MDTKFQWTNFYMELATALLEYKNNRSELIGKLKTIFSDAGMNFPFKEKAKRHTRTFALLLSSVHLTKELPMPIELLCWSNLRNSFQ